MVVALGIWEYLGHSSKTLNLTFSNPIDTAKWIWQWAEGKQGHGWSDLWVTLEEAAFGMFLVSSSGWVWPSSSRHRNGSDCSRRRL